MHSIQAMNRPLPPELPPRLLRLVVLAFTGLAACIQYCFAVTLPLSSAQRANLLSNVSQNSDLILTASVTGADGMIDSRGDVWTRYTLEPINAIHGTPEPEVTFLRLGGSTDSASTFVVDSEPILPGHDYLLFLSRCIGKPEYKLTSAACVAEVLGDSARTVNPRYVALLASIVDSIQFALGFCDPTTQQANADAVILGVPLSVTPSTVSPLGLQRTTSQWQVRVLARLKQTLGPTVSTGDIVSVDLPMEQSLHIYGSRPVPELGDTSLVFLIRAGDRWSFGASAYSVWRRVGEEAVVEGLSFPCGAPRPLHTVPWESLMGMLGF